MSLDALLDGIYNQGSAQAIEKTAEARLLEALSEDAVPAANPYDDLSLEELTKLASEVGVEMQDGSQYDEMEKAAYEALGGQIMAHAATQELGLIKEALSSGLCRVCKTNELDTQGSSICSNCLQG